MAEMVSIRVDQSTYQIDFDSLTLGELEAIEREFDKPLGDIDLASARGILVLAWIAKRRSEPLCTLDEIRSLPQSAVEIEEGDAGPLPVDGADTAEDSGIPS